MSAYLQRLLDRGAGLAAGSHRGAMPGAHGALAGAEVAPVATSTSPSVQFDQRLADPLLAADYGLLGLSADLAPMEGDEALSAALPDNPPPPPTAAAQATRPGQPVAAAQPEAPRPTGRDARSPAAAPPLATRPVESTPQRTDAASYLLPLSAKPVSQPHSDAAPPRPQPPASPPAAIVRPVDRRAAHAAAVPTLAPHRDAEPVPAGATASPPVAPVQPQAVTAVTPASVRVSPSLQSAEAPAGPPTPASPSRLTEAQPPRRSPAPLDPPPRRLPDPDELERLVRTAVQAELARRPSPAAAAAPAPSAAPADRADPPPRRPATAQEASVIGPLSASSAPQPLYGLRRR